jgi:hypothetical protein
MAVYVNKLRDRSRFLLGRTATIGVRHLLTEGQRDRAVELGAQETTAREADQMERQRAAARGESQF